MFQKTKIPTGAREKIEMAKKMHAKGFFSDSRGGGGGETRYPSQTVPITLIFALAVILAFVLTGSGSSPLSGIHFTGISSVDSFITGTDIPTFTGNPDNDKVITIMGRGLAFFALAGVVPLIAFILEKTLLKRTVMPLVICWGIIIALMVIYLCVPADTIGPFFKSLLPVKLH